jgi:phosphatidylglycerophosphate synthase
MLDAPLQRLLSEPTDRMAAMLQRAGIGPNTITFVGFVFGLLAAAATGGALYIAGLVFLTLHRIADLLDGAVARRTNATALGAFLDLSLGYIIFGIVAFAFVLARQQNGLAGTFLILGLLADAVTAMGVRAFSVPPLPKRGPLPRSLIITGPTATYILFVIMMLAPWSFGFLPYLYGVLCFVSAGARIAAATAFMDPSARP